MDGSLARFVHWYRMRAVQFRFFYGVVGFAVGLVAMTVHRRFVRRIGVRPSRPRLRDMNASRSGFCLCFFSPAPSGESLLLRTIVRARFQLVGFAGVAVEVNDFFSGLSCFGHNASLSGTFRVALVCWLATAEAPASQVASASCYRVSEYVGVLAIVLAELKLIQVQRQIFLAYVVIGADDSPFQQAPEALNRIRVNETAYIFAATMADDAMRILISESKQPIAGMLIGSDQIDSATNGLSHKTIQRWRIGILDHLADHVALPRDRADDSYLVAVMMAGSVLALICVSVFVLTADIGLVNFDDAHKLLEIIVLHSGAQTMADVPCGMQRRTLAEIHASDLSRRYALQTLQHRVENLEPRDERHVGILEYRADQNGEPIRCLAAFLADPMKRFGLEGIDFFVSASRTLHAIRPAAIRKELTAGWLIGESRHELLESHHA